MITMITMITMIVIVSIRKLLIEINIYLKIKINQLAPK